MARKNLQEVKNDNLKPIQLNEIIDSYGKIKDEINSLDKEAKFYNVIIKEQIKDAVKEKDNKYEYEADDYIATLTMRDTSKMNEEKLISYLKKNKLAKNIVKKKEYVDENAFEEAVYKGIITEEQLLEMDNCKDVSVSEVLTIKRRK